MEIKPTNKKHHSSVDPSQCNGCGVCMLSCPVWQQHHTKALTVCGRIRSSIGGAAGEDLVDSAQACILCGSCEPLCPMGISTLEATIALRRDLVAQGLLAPRPAASSSVSTNGKTASQLFLAGRTLLADAGLIERIARLLGQDIGISGDDGQDIVFALESGDVISKERMKAFIEPFLRCSRLIVSDGLLFNLLRMMLPPGIELQSLGRALLANPKVRAGLRTADLFIIESRAYNATRREAVKYYDEMRQEIGCSLNLDLQRVAIPTGAASFQHKSGMENAVSIEAQVNWILEGRKPERIVAEHPDDVWAFREYTSLPVLHLSEVVLP